MLQARTGLAQDEWVGGQLVHRHGLLSRQGVVVRDDEDDAVVGQVAVLQVRVVVPSPDPPDTHLAPLHLADHRRAVADRGPYPDERVLRSVSREQGGKEVLAWDRTCGDGEFALHRRLAAGDFFARRAVEGADAAGVLVQPAAGVGEFDLPTDATEQGNTGVAFEGLNPLADGRLGQVERAGGGGETGPLGGLGEGLQVRQQFGLHGGYVTIPVGLLHPRRANPRHTRVSRPSRKPRPEARTPRV